MVATLMDMSDISEQLKKRSRTFGVNVLRLIDAFPRRVSLQVVSFQLAKAATSTGSNYRAACTARSRREYLAKMQTVSEESDEAVFWFEVLEELGTVASPDVGRLLDEAIQLRKIFGKSLGTARNNDRSRTDE
jgi:four helix bundle protein